MQQTPKPASTRPLVPQQTRPHGPQETGHAQTDALTEAALAHIVGGGDGGPGGPTDNTGVRSL